jgi:hypothetical protein
MKSVLVFLVLAFVGSLRASAGVTLYVTPLGADRWAVQYEADVPVWSGGFIIDGATAFAFAGLDANGDPGPALNATYDPSVKPKALPGSVIGEPMPSLLVNPHGGELNSSMGPVATRIDLGVATVPGRTPAVRYSAIEAVVPNLWAGSGAYMPSSAITISVESASPVPALPGSTAALLAALLLALSWALVRANRAA